MAGAKNQTDSPRAVSSTMTRAPVATRAPPADTSTHRRPVKVGRPWIHDPADQPSDPTARRIPASETVEPRSCVSISGTKVMVPLNAALRKNRLRITDGRPAAIRSVPRGSSRGVTTSSPMTPRTAAPVSHENSRTWS